MILCVIIHLNQHCYAQERTIKNAASGNRDKMAYAVQTQRGIRILSLDFRSAFDKVSHDYMHNILSDFFYGTLVRLPRAL
jgi:hypothetical protein